MKICAKYKKELACYAVLYLIYFVYLIFNDISGAYLRKNAYHPPVEQLEQTVDTEQSYFIPLHDGSSIIYQIKVSAEDADPEGITVVAKAQSKDSTERLYEHKYSLSIGENLYEGSLPIKNISSIQLNLQGENISEKIQTIDVIEENARVVPWLGYVLNALFAGVYSLTSFCFLYLAFTLNIKRTTLIYTGCSIIITLLLFAFSMSIWKWNFFSEPLKGYLPINDDAVFLMNAKRAVMGNDFWLLNNLAAPSGDNFFQFPLLQKTYYLFCYFCGLFTDNFFLVSNLYYLMTFILAALFFGLSLKNIVQSKYIRIFGGILFAFSQYHFFRGMTHVTASSYFVTPIVFYYLQYIYRFIADEGEQLNKKHFWGIIAGSFLIASTDPMYAYFSCLLIIPHTVLGIVAKRPKAAYYSGAIVALIVLFGAINVAPSIVYKLINGSTLTRTAYEAHWYGLNIPQLFAPLTPNAILSGVRILMNRTGLTQTGSYLGIWGTIGFIILFIGIFIRRIPIVKREFWKELCAKTEVMDIPLLLTLFIGVSGGFGFLISVLGFTTIRTYNRISVFILCFSVASFCILVDYIFKKRSGLQRYLVGFIVIATIVHFYDSNLRKIEHISLSAINALYNAGNIEKERRFYQDVALYNRSLYPENRAVILQVPYLPFPENVLDNRLGNCNVQLYGYFFTNDDLCWSYGATKYSNQDNADELYVNNKSIEMALSYGIDNGFAGVIAYPRLNKDGMALIKNIERTLGKAAEIKSLGSEQEYYFDLKNVTKPLFAPAAMDDIMTESNFMTGWYGKEYDHDKKFHWSKKEAALRFIPYNMPYRITLNVCSVRDTLLTIVLNDGVLGAYHIKAGENIIYSPVIHEKRFNMASAVNILNLRSNDAFIPAEIDRGSNDFRELGLMFREIRLEPAIKEMSNE